MNARAKARSARTPTLKANRLRRPSPAKLRAIARAAAASRVMAQKVSERLAATTCAKSSTPRHAVRCSHSKAQVPNTAPSLVARRRSPSSTPPSGTNTSPNYDYFASVLGHSQVVQSPNSSPSLDQSPVQTRNSSLEQSSKQLGQSLNQIMGSSQKCVDIRKTPSHSWLTPVANSMRWNASLLSLASRESGDSHASPSSLANSTVLNDLRPTLSPPAMQTTQAMLRENVLDHVATPTAARPCEAHVLGQSIDKLGHDTPPADDPTQKGMKGREASFPRANNQNLATCTRMPPLSAEAAPTPEAALPSVPVTQQVKLQESEIEPAGDQDLMSDTDPVLKAGHSSSVSGSDSDVFYDAQEGSSCSDVSSPEPKAFVTPATDAGHNVKPEPTRGHDQMTEICNESETKHALELGVTGEAGHRFTAPCVHVTNTMKTVADSAFATVRSAVAKVPSCANSNDRIPFDRQLHYDIARIVSLADAPAWYRKEMQKVLLTGKPNMPAASSRSEACDEERSNNIELDHLQTSEESKAGPSSLTPTGAKRLRFEPPRWFKIAEQQRDKCTSAAKVERDHSINNAANNDSVVPARSMQQVGEPGVPQCALVQSAAKVVCTENEAEAEMKLEAGAGAEAAANAEADYGAEAEIGTESVVDEELALTEVEAQGGIQTMHATDVSSSEASFSVVAQEEPNGGVERGTSHHQGNEHIDTEADLVISRALAACEASARVLCCNADHNIQHSAVPSHTEDMQQRRLASPLSSQSGSVKLKTSAAIFEQHSAAACAQVQKPAKRHSLIRSRLRMDIAKRSIQPSRPDREDGGLPRSWRQQHKHKHRRWLQRLRSRGSSIKVGTVAERKASTFAKLRNSRRQCDTGNDGPMVEWIVLPHTHSCNISPGTNRDDRAPGVNARESERHRAAMSAALAATAACSAALAAANANTVASAVLSSVAAFRASQAAALASTSATAGVVAAYAAVTAAKAARTSSLESCARAASHAALFAAHGADAAMHAAANAASMIAAIVAVAAAASAAAKADSALLSASAPRTTSLPASDAVNATLGYLRARANAALTKLSGAVKAHNISVTDVAERAANVHEGLDQDLDLSLSTKRNTELCGPTTPSVPSLPFLPPVAPALDSLRSTKSSALHSVRHDTYSYVVSVVDEFQERVQHYLNDMQTQHQRQFQQLLEQQAHMIQFQHQQQHPQLARSRPIQSPIARAAPQVEERGTQVSPVVDSVITMRSLIADTCTQKTGLQAAEDADPKQLLKALQVGEAEMPRDPAYFLSATVPSDESDEHGPLAFAAYEPLEEVKKCGPDSMAIPPLQSNSILQRWSRCRRPSAIAADITYDDELPLLQSMYLLRSGDVELGGIN